MWSDSHGALWITGWDSGDLFRYWALALRSGIGVLLTALLVPPLLAPITAEERLLCAEFGRDYEAYRSRTSRLIPEVF